MLASAQAQPSLVLHKVQASGVKVVNVPGGESLSAIDIKVAVIAEALGKNGRRRPAPAASAADRRHSTQPVAKRVLFILSHGGMNTPVVPDSIPRPMAPFKRRGLQNAMQGFDHYRAMSQEGVASRGSGGDLADGLKGMGGGRAVETARLAQTRRGVINSC